MTDLEKLETMVGALLGKELPTQARIRELIEEARALCPGVNDQEAEQLAIRFEEVHGVTMTDGAILQEGGFEPWLEAARAGIGPYYWERYRKLLVSKGFSRQVLASVDGVTDRILGLLENPVKTGNWIRRGMVMGHVQSGKTANYIGLVCKAADAGYKVIVIIAGIHNNLRNQTQRRIDEGFVGVDSTGAARGAVPAQRRVGVGYWGFVRRPVSFTTQQRDFSRTIADSVGLPLQNLKEPVAFVIKKNARTLRNLIEWLKAHNAQHGTLTIREPMLLVDDEADNASINIGQRQDEVSRINGQIRELLALFDRRCYVGYTATPFANIFIDPDSEHEMLGDDLFPRDFIVSLDPPDNYFGATKVFVEDPDAVVRPVDDNGDLLPVSHPIDHPVTGLPESLEEAVRVFVLARAIRLARGHAGSHNSMLVNISRFVGIQRQVRNELHALVQRIRSSARVHGATPAGEARKDSEIEALYRAFEHHYGHLPDASWPAVQAHLHDSASAVNVVEVNSRSVGSLDYAAHDSAGLNVIAVGGLSLSRGLTLEGLVVSYFLRNSVMYDTLLQMGRWFGYRPGYEDLCRVWMPEEAQGWYAHIAESIEELRDELARMQSTNATPTDFGLRVRSHPDTLVVTARNKMGSGKTMRVLIGLAKKWVETTILRREPRVLEANRQAAVFLARNLRREGFAPENGESVSGGRLVRGVPVSMVDAFLLAFRNHDGSLSTETQPVRNYISIRQADELASWDVLFAGVTPQEAEPGSLSDSSLGFQLICQRRAAAPRSDDRTLVVSSRHRLSSRGIERTGLTDEEVHKAKEYFDNLPSTSKDHRANYPDWVYRRFRTRPLLVVHLLAIGNKGDDMNRNRPVVAWSIGFPETDHREEKVEYVVNTTWYREHYQDEDDEDAGDDD